MGQLSCDEGDNKIPTSSFWNSVSKTWHISREGISSQSQDPLPRLPTHIPTFWMKRSIFVLGELFSVRGGAEGFGCGRGVVRRAAGVYRAL